MSDRISADTAEVQELFRSLLRRASDLTPISSELGEIGLTDIQDHFEQGGYPAGSWKKLRKVTIAQRQKKNLWPGLILVRHGVAGGLLGAVNYRAFPGGVVWSANKPYARIHNDGGMAGRGRKVRIPKREYMLFSDEAIEEMMDAIAEWIVEGSD